MLQEFFAKQCELFKEVTIDFDTCELMDNLLEEYNGHSWDITHGRLEEDRQVFGVGSSGDEVDHDHDRLPNGHYFHPPTKEQMKEMDRIAEKFGLPKPKMFTETRYS